MFKFFLFSSFVLFLNYVHSQEISKECFTKSNEAEKLFKTLLRIESFDTKAVVTKEDFKEFCDQAKNGIVSLREFIGCLNALPKQVFTVFYKNAQKGIKKYCVTDATRAANALRCFENDELMASYRSCLFEFSANSNYAVYEASEKDTIPSFCCGYSNMIKCFTKEFTKTNICKKDNFLLKFNKEFTADLFGGSMELLCSSFNSDTCENKLNSLMKKMKSYSKKNPVSFNNYSVIKEIFVLSNKLSS